MSVEILCHCGRDTYQRYATHEPCCVPCSKPTDLCVCSIIGVGISLEFVTGPTDGLCTKQSWPRD